MSPASVHGEPSYDHGSVAPCLTCLSLWPRAGKPPHKHPEALVALSGSTPSAGTLLLGEDGRYSIAGPAPAGIEDVYQVLTTLASAAERVPASLIARMTGRDAFEVHAALGLLELAGRARGCLCPSCPSCAATGAGWEVGAAVPLGESQTCGECSRSYPLTPPRLLFLYRPR